MSSIATSKGLIIADFTVSHYAKFLNRSENLPKLSVKVAPFGQVFNTLIDRNLPCWKPEPDFVVIWTQPEKIIKSFDLKMNAEKVSTGRILKEVDDFAEMILKLADRVKIVIMPTWKISSADRGYGILELRQGLGLRQTLMEMNLRLTRKLSAKNNIFLLDSSLWFSGASQASFNAQLWYLGKIPFADEVFLASIGDIKAVLRANLGLTKKLIIVDLDDTLWGGIVGDAGWQHLNLGGHNALGEAFLDFQKALKRYQKRGILLAIVSKNEEATALEAIKKHPEMVLKVDDFAGWRINWEDKAKNIADLVSQLNLGLQSVVFIDDNPVERARVKEALPEVTVPDWPADKMLYKNTLLGLDLFDVAAISKEDLERAKMYQVENKRETLKTKFADLDSWLKTLKIKVVAQKLNEANLARTAQLLNKTNQMNLTTRRMTDKELMAWSKAKNHELWTFRVADRFGDSGLTGIASLEIENQAAQVTDFILSCRVMGRKVEETMLAVLARQAKKAGASKLIAKYLPTAKNKPCLDFFSQSGLDYDSKKKTFSWDLKKAYPVPKLVEVKEKK